MKKDEFEDRESTNQVNSGKKRGKKVIIALIGIISIFLIVAMVFGISYLNREKSIKQADTFISIEKYDDGIAIYDNLLSKKYSLALMNKRSLAVELMESDGNLKKGLDAYEEGDINRAVKFLSKVSKDDQKRYEIALDELNKIEETILIDIYQLIEDGNLDEANEIANDYLKIDLNNVKMQNAKDSINFKKSEAEKQTKSEEKDKEIAATTALKQAELDAINAKDNSQARITANNIIGSYKYIIANEANLRDAPTLKSGIVTVLYRGAEVYIYDTQVESSERIWCYISTEESGYTEYGWISYNTMNYNIQ